MKWHRQRHAGLLFLQAALFVANCLAENLVLDVSLGKPIAVTSDAFLSLTVDPATLSRNADDLAKNIVASTNMARGLAPAYIRLGGPQSNSHIFERTCSNGVDSDNVFCETHWMLLHEWAQNAGLDVIACVAPRSLGNGSHSGDLARFVSFSDDMDYNVSLQVGYECQTRCELSGEDLGRRVANLRELLKGFPRYSDSLITGPDIVSYGTTRQQKYIEDYLTAAGAALSAITWHPNFAGASSTDGNITVDCDNIAAEKSELYKIISRAAERKPLWIAESKPEKHSHQYLGALVWTRRLGSAAKLGAQVVMRQPSSLHRATPDYWVSLLHKRLVGREVLAVRPEPDGHVYLYAQCTKPSALYGRGAVTIFGVNFTPDRATASLKGVGAATLHAYVLSPDPETDKLSSKYVLLNNKPLDLIDDEELPDLSPEIIVDPDGLEFPPASIGFWVLPDAKAKACTEPEEKAVESAKRISRRHEENLGGRESEKDPSHASDRKTHATRKRRERKHVEPEGETARDSKFLARLSKMLRRRLRLADGSTKLQRSVTVDLERGSSEESDENSDAERFEKEAVVGVPGDTRDASGRYKGENTGRSGRGRRDLGSRRLLEAAARRDNIHRKSSRAVDYARDYHERRARRRDDLRRETGLVVPFSPRIAPGRDDSGENTFYGFFRQPPARGFPESDVYGTVGDSSEPAGAEYDYVQDDDDPKNPRREEEKTRDRADEDAQLGDEGGEHAPNEFFENVRVAGAGARATSTDYGDLWEAEFARAASTGSSKEQTKSELSDSAYSPDPGEDRARVKRSSERLREVLAEEMFKNEEDARGCRRRVIRLGSLEEDDENQVADCPRETESATDIVAGRRDLETEEEDEEDATSEVTTNDIESERGGATTEASIRESDGLNYEPSDVMRIIETAEALEANNALERVSQEATSAVPMTAAALDSAQALSTSPADTAENQGRYSYVVTTGTTASHDEAENVEGTTTEALISYEKSTASSKSVRYPGESVDAQVTIEARMPKEDDERATARSPKIESDNEATTCDASRITTETSTSKEVAIVTSRLNKSAMMKAPKRRKSEGEAEIVAREKDTRNSTPRKTTPPTVHKVPLRKLTRYEEYLVRRAEQIDRKLRERLARRTKS